MWNILWARFEAAASLAPSLRLLSRAMKIRDVVHAISPTRTKEGTRSILLT